MTTEEKARRIQKLYQNKEFQEMILEDFLGQSISTIVLNENVESRAVQDQLNARRILHDWMYGIIQQGEIAKKESKDT